jgi:hypothetical protein
VVGVLTISLEFQPFFQIMDISRLKILIFKLFHRTSWTPFEKRGKEEFLEVKFKQKLYLKKLKIFETNCPVN